jgi:hypothetical protein
VTSTSSSACCTPSTDSTGRPSAAHHWLPNGDRWTVYGHYIARLGRIAELTLQTLYAGGHDCLPSISARRPGDWRDPRSK